MALMQNLGELAAIWRYPVKSLAAQPLASTLLETGGIPGDRAGALFVQSGHARAGKTFRGKEHQLLHTVTQPQAAARIAAQAGVRVEMRAEPGVHYFDDAPVSLIFDRWIAEVEKALDMPLDPRRWRPNFYARGAAEFDSKELQLLGRVIEMGEAVLRVRDTIGRCVTTTYDIETGERDDDVLLYVAQKRDNVMGVYCDVELAGTVRVGDALRLRDR
ncbi:MAG TPA: MOSC domain-containing protein [Candidatus Baltobacteraceae bacterium]